MKKLFICLIVFCFSLLKINAQGIPENDNLLMDKFIQSITKIEKTKIVSDTLEKVFTGAFYKVAPVFTTKDGSQTCSSYDFVVKNGELIELENLSEKKIMKLLFSLLQSGFYLKSDGDAKFFETALDKIYPLDWSDSKYKEHLKINKKWYFVRGKFFDSKEAFIITLDENSKISQIDFDLKAIEK
jgi:hypothetical protein